MQSREATGEVVEEEIVITRSAGEKLGFGLRFEGGGRASECVKRLYIQCCSPCSPAARAASSWGGVGEGACSYSHIFYVSSFNHPVIQLN